MSSETKKVYLIDRLAYRGLIFMSKLTIAAIFAASISVLSSAYGIADTPEAVTVVNSQLQQAEAAAEAAGESISWRDRIKGAFDKTKAAGESLIDGVFDKEEREKRKDEMIQRQTAEIIELRKRLADKVVKANIGHAEMIMCVDRVGKYLKEIPYATTETVSPPTATVQ